MGAKIYTIDESVGSVIVGYDTCCNLYIRLLESYMYLSDNKSFCRAYTL
jgi:hypothetical protein